MKSEMSIAPRDAVENVLFDSASKALGKIEAAEGKAVTVYLKQHYTGIGYRAAVANDTNKRPIIPVLVVGRYRAGSIGYEPQRIAEDVLATYRNLAG